MDPTPFTPQPFTYQLAGACAAAWEGHTLIADEPGLGKSLQALLTARLLDARRVLIVCPPILTTNWEKETRRTNNAEATDGEIFTITPKEKRPEDKIIDRGYVIVADSLITARRSLEQALANWAPDLLVIDEAHRMKNPAAKRTRALLRIAERAGHVVCLTGTPIVSTPLDVLPLLQALGKLPAISPSVTAFRDRYTREIRAGWRVPRTEHLPELHALLAEHVWTRRTKAQVLTDLPAKMRTTVHVDPDGTELDEAYADLHETIDAWLETHPDPSSDQIDSLVGDAMPFISRLRRATGLAKIPAATAWILDHLDGAPGQPLIAWTIHRDVTAQLVAQIASERPQTAVRVLDGSTPHHERSEAVEAFQGGQVDVLVAQIVAAGVGLTLTRSTTALFVETDWVPANQVQAEDRIHRIGQTMPVQITTLIAEHTLDARIHAVLARTIATLDQLTPGSDHAVTRTDGDSTSPRELIRELIDQRIATHQIGAAA